MGRQDGYRDARPVRRLVPMMRHLLFVWWRSAVSEVK